MTFIETDLIQRRVQRRLQRLTGKDRFDLTDSETFGELKKHLKLEYQQEQCIREEKLVIGERQRMDKLAEKNLEINDYLFNSNHNHTKPKGKISKTKILKTEFVPNPIRKSNIDTKFIQTLEVKNSAIIDTSIAEPEYIDENNEKKPKHNNDNMNNESGNEIVTDECIYQMKRPFTARILELQKEKELAKIYEIAENLMKTK